MKVCDFVKVDQSGLLRGTWAPSWAQESVSRASDTVVAGRWPGWHLKNCGGEKGGSCLGKEEHQLSFGDSRCRVWEGRQQVSEGLNDKRLNNTTYVPILVLIETEWHWYEEHKEVVHCPVSTLQAHNLIFWVFLFSLLLVFIHVTINAHWLPLACHHKCRSTTDSRQFLSSSLHFQSEL